MSTTVAPNTSTETRRDHPRRSWFGEFLNRRNVRTRLLVLVSVFGVASVVTVAVSAYGLLSSRSEAARANHGFDAYAAEHRAYEGWLTDDDQSNMTAALASLRRADERGLLDATMAQVLQGHAQAVSALELFARAAQTPGERALARRLLADIGAYNVYTNRVLADVRAGRLVDAVLAVAVSNANISNKTQADFNALSAKITDAVNAIEPQLDAANTLALVLLILISVGSGVLALFVVRRVMLTVTKPLERITEALELVGAGDLTARANVRAGDEFGRVAEMLNHAIAQEEMSMHGERTRAGTLRTKVDELLEVVNRAASGDLTVAIPHAGEDAIGQMGTSLSDFFADLRDRIAAIRASAEQLASASAQLGATAARMSSTATDTSQQVTEVSSASREISAHVRSAAAAAEQLTESITEISASVSKASEIASEAVEAAGAANQTVAKLAESSQQIGEVTDVISAISRQTNLLALNASIEAARSGEAGKAFAVVADQVKTLAHETGQATIGITETIELIQHDSESARQAISRIGEIIVAIDQLQMSIADAVRRQSETTTEIARTVAGAAEGTGGITTTMAGVAHSADSTTGGAAETEAAADQLAQTAAELQTLISRFAV